METIRNKVEKIKSDRSRVLLKYRDTELFKHLLKDVKKVVVINSSSRSGSSLLYAILRKLPQVYSLTGEAAPFYKLNTSIDDLNLFESDKIPEFLIDSVMDMEGLSRDFFSDLYLSGYNCASTDVDFDMYADHIMLRFMLQWTDIDFDIPVFRQLIFESLERYAAHHRNFVIDDFYLDLLKEICVLYPKINPYYYDISTEKVARYFPLIVLPTGPPNEYFNIEEPPFILQTPGTKARPEDFQKKILLLKSTVDCYRMNLLEKIFPDADIRIIHLVRNPAATVNGIYDGWLHRGFFSHNLRPFFFRNSGLKKLSIKGYSDVFPFGTYWWNFDLPEGWETVADKELIEVSAFQWYSANREILDYLATGNTRSCMVRYENIFRNMEMRREEFCKILDFAGIPENSLNDLPLDNFPVVQATLPPQLYRWKKSEHIIMKIMQDPKIMDMSAQLGYMKENMEDWL